MTEATDKKEKEVKPEKPEPVYVPESQLPSRGGRWNGANLPKGWTGFTDDQLDSALKVANKAVAEGKSEAESIRLGKQAADEWKPA